MLSGNLVGLRALEKSDLDYLYKWENDPKNWEVSGTLAPYSRDTIAEFIANSDKDIFVTKQLRFIIEAKDGLPVGTIDLSDFDPAHRRAGVGILIGDSNFRHKGFATEALLLLEEYCAKVLKIHQLHCLIDDENTPSIGLFTKLGYVKTGTKLKWLIGFDNQFRNVGFYQKFFGV